jgi:hypothetical protein
MRGLSVSIAATLATAAVMVTGAAPATLGFAYFAWRAVPLYYIPL